MAALRRVWTLRGKDGPPLRLVEQLRGLWQPSSFRGVRHVPANLRDTFLGRRRIVFLGGAVVTSEQYLCIFYTRRYRTTYRYLTR